MDGTTTPTAALVGLLYGAAENITPDARRVAGASLLDWIAVTLLGADDPIIDTLVAEAVAEGEGRSTLIGRTEKLRSTDAALINGVAGHVIDYDDGLAPMMGHPSAPILPALLAVAEQRHAFGRDFVTAHVLAVEAAARIGLYVTEDHYTQGFHATATVGAMAAAAGCAWLIGLDRQGMETALGIAGARAAGLKSSFGTSMKPVQVGWAAMVGLTAAQWAARGLTANRDILGDVQGFARTHGTNASRDAMLAPAPNGFHICDTGFKRFASCGGTHATLDAWFALTGQTRFVADEIEAIDLRVWKGADRVCNIANPTTGLETKFSLRGTLAMAMLGLDLADPGSFNAETTTSPRLIELRDRIAVTVLPDVDYGKASLSVSLRDGRVLRADHDDAEHRPGVDKVVADVGEKSASIVARWGGAERGAGIMTAVAGIEDRGDVAELMELLRR